MERLPTIQPVEPVITENNLTFEWNFKEVKKYLEAVTEKYCGLIATDQNLQDFEKARREVVKLRTTLTKFKADGKRALKAPSDTFARQCDELIAVVTDVEMPINAQLQKYEEDRKQRIQKAILMEYDKQAASVHLSAKVWNCEINPKWLNKTAKWSDICQGIEELVNGQLAQMKAQEAEQQANMAKIEVVKTSVELANQKYHLKTPLKEWEAFPGIDTYLPGYDESFSMEGYTMDDIKTIVEDMARERHEIEERAKEPVEEPIQEPEPWEVEPEKDLAPIDDKPLFPSFDEKPKTRRRYTVEMKFSVVADETLPLSVQGAIKEFTEYMKFLHDIPVEVKSSYKEVEE